MTGAHAALVSEADFIDAQDASAPRGLAARRYLLSCGQCARRLERDLTLFGAARYRCAPRR